MDAKELAELYLAEQEVETSEEANALAEAYLSDTEEPQEQEAKEGGLLDTVMDVAEYGNPLTRPFKLYKELTSDDNDLLPRNKEDLQEVAAGFMTERSAVDSAVELVSAIAPQITSALQDTYAPGVDADITTLDPRRASLIAGLSMQWGGNDMDPSTGWTDISWRSAAEKYGPEYMDESLDWKGRLAVANKQRAAAFDHAYGHVGHSGLRLAGGIGRDVFDPINVLFPGGGTVVKGFLWGAIDVGIQEGLRQLAKDGHISVEDATQIAINAGVGGGFNAALVGIIKQAAKQKERTNRQLGVEEARDVVNKFMEANPENKIDKKEADQLIAELIQDQETSIDTQQTIMQLKDLGLSDHEIAKYIDYQKSGQEVIDDELRALREEEGIEQVEEFFESEGQELGVNWIDEDMPSFDPDTGEQLTPLPKAVEAVEPAKTSIEVEPTSPKQQELDLADTITEYKEKRVVVDHGLKGSHGKPASARRINDVIYLNPTKALEDFKRQAWTKPKYRKDTFTGKKRQPTAKALPKDQFSTYAEWERFLLEHEFQHMQYSKEDYISDMQSSGEQPTMKGYESIVNDRAILALALEAERVQKVAQKLSHKVSPKGMPDVETSRGSKVDAVNLDTEISTWQTLPRLVGNAKGKPFDSIDEAVAARNNMKTGALYQVVDNGDGKFLLYRDLVDPEQTVSKMSDEARAITEMFVKFKKDDDALAAMYEESEVAKLLIARRDEINLSMEGLDEGEWVREVLRRGLDPVDMNIYALLSDMKDWTPNSEIPFHAKAWFNKDEIVVTDGVERVLRQSVEAAKAVSAPNTVLPRFGAPGQMILEGIERSRQVANLFLARRMNAIDKLLYDNGMLVTNPISRSKRLKAQQGVVTYLRNPDGIPLSKYGDLSARAVKRDALALGVSEEAVRVGKQLRYIFEEALEFAVKSGVLTREAAQALSRNAKIDGYFPHVFDFAKLNNKLGKKKFKRDLLMAYKSVDEETAGKLLEYILGSREPGMVPKYFTQAEEDGLLEMTDPAAEMLWRSLMERNIANRSTHLEHSRKIPKELEEVLMDFLETDVQKVMQAYLADTYGRISNASVFGEGDQVYLSAKNRLADMGYTEEELRYVDDVYYTHVGDAKRSRPLQSAMEQHAFTKWLGGRIKAFEMFHLTMAAITNSPQALVNGTTMMARAYGYSGKKWYKATPTALYDATRAIARQFVDTKSNVQSRLRGDFRTDLADDTGAAMVNVIMQTMMEHTGVSNTITGYKARGVLRPLNFFQDPTTFLTYTGFQLVEKFQRKFAANMGIIMTERLLKERIRLMEIEASPQGMSKQQQYDLRMVNEQLKEFGILDPDHATTANKLLAAQRFSDKVNFVNTAETMPTGWQHANVFLDLVKQFRTFMYHHTRLLRINALAPAREAIASQKVRAKERLAGKSEKELSPVKGTIAPLMAYLAVGTPIGMTIHEFKRMLMADDRELSTTERVVFGNAAVGGMGIVWDGAQSFEHGAKGFAGFVGGPAFSDLLKMVEAYTIANQRYESRGEFDWKHLGKTTAELYGPLGIPIKRERNRLKSEKEKSVTEADRILEKVKRQRRYESGR